MTVDQALAVVFKWLKIVCSLALLVFITLVLFKLFGFSLFPVPALGFQELGVFLAGTAYAIKAL